MMMQMVGSFAECERAMIRERTSAGLAQARAEGRIGGRRRKLGDKQRREIAESVTSGRKFGAEMARLYGVSEPMVSRIVAAHRPQLCMQQREQEYSVFLVCLASYSSHPRRRGSRHWEGQPA